MSIENLKIYSILTPEDSKDILKSQIEWEKYFNLKHKIISENKVSSLNKKSVDILFVSDKFFNKISNELINQLKEKNNQFNFVVISNVDNKKNVHFLKNYADHIIYRNLMGELKKWKTIAILRRYWNTFSKPTTLMYKNIIADFVENKVTVDGQDLDLTAKEIKLLWNFMNQIGDYISKETLFKNVWGIEDSDSTRVLNQMIFKLKNKIGKEYFHTIRSKGIMFK